MCDCIVFKASKINKNVSKKLQILGIYDNDFSYNSPEVSINFRGGGGWGGG